MIAWIIQIIVFAILMIILGCILYLPYFLIQKQVRVILYRMGYDCYTEEEKVLLGLNKTNRIEDLKYQIEIEKNLKRPVQEYTSDGIYNNYFPSKQLSKKLIEHKKIIDGSKEVDLNEITRSLKEINKKYSTKG